MTHNKTKIFHLLILEATEIGRQIVEQTIKGRNQKEIGNNVRVSKVLLHLALGFRLHRINLMDSSYSKIQISLFVP